MDHSRIAVESVEWHGDIWADLADELREKGHVREDENVEAVTVTVEVGKATVVEDYETNGTN